MSEQEPLGNFEYEEPMQEKCGIVALHLPSESSYQLLALTLKAGGGVQHRGQQGVGLAMHTAEGVISHKANGLIKERFTSDILEQFSKKERGDWTLLHTRWGTVGGQGDHNLQPCTSTSPDGTSWSVIHNGEFVVTEMLREKLNSLYPDDVSDTFLFTELLAQTEGASLDERVIKALSQAQGAFSMVIGVENKLYLARDEFGIRPFVLGQINGGYVAASETFALKKIGIEPQFELRRGEISRIDEDGLTIIQDGFDGQGYPCIIEPAYNSHPGSRISLYTDPAGRNPAKWKSIYSTRERIGIILAEENKIPNIDYVTGVADSGVPAAIGVAMGARLPYRQVLIRDHYDQFGDIRQFQDAILDSIASKVLGKIAPVDEPELFEGKNIIVVDDSGIRFNVSKELTKPFKALGVNEIHWMFGFPPVIKTCHLGVNIRSESELLAAKLNGDVQKIAEYIGATSVRYISPVGFLRALGRKKEDIIMPEDPKEIYHANHVCGGCLTGVYPISKDGVVYKSSDPRFNDLNLPVRQEGH